MYTLPSPRKNQLLESGDFVKNQQKLLPSLQDITKVDLRDLKKCASPKPNQLLLNPAVLAGQVKLHFLRYKFAHSSVAYIRTCNNCCVITEATLLATLQSHLLFASYSPFDPPIMEFLVPKDHSRFAPASAPLQVVGSPSTPQASPSSPPSSSSTPQAPKQELRCRLRDNL